MISDYKLELDFIKSAADVSPSVQFTDDLDIMKASIDSYIEHF